MCSACWACTYGRIIKYSTFPFFPGGKRTWCSCDGVRWLYRGKVIANKLYTLTNVVSVGRCGKPKLEKLFANAFKEAMHVINDCSIDNIEGRQNVQGGYPFTPTHGCM